VENFCLGTAKLGSPDYGFASLEHVPNTFNSFRFLSQVELLGIDRFDISPRYGDSEEMLGTYFKHCKRRPVVSSKIDNLTPGNPKTPVQMLESVNRFLKRLCIDQLEICYLHQNQLSIISDPYVQEGLSLLKERKLIRYNGVSLYSFPECDYVIESEFYDFIQVPINICDISFYIRYIANNVSKSNFVARSLLLQGLLINRKYVETITNSDKALDYFKRIDILVNQHKLTSLQIALRFVFSLEKIDHFMIGTTSILNLKKNLKCASRRIPTELHKKLFSMASSPKIWANPRNW